MIRYPDGYEVPLRSGAVGSVDPESVIGPHNIPWDDATEAVRDAGLVYEEIIGARRRAEQEGADQEAANDAADRQREAER